MIPGLTFLETYCHCAPWAYRQLTCPTLSAQSFVKFAICPYNSQSLHDPYTGTGCAGVLLNVLFPDWLLTFLLTTLLLWLTARISLKACRLFKVRCRSGAAS